MPNMGLVLNMLTDTSSTEISKGINPNRFEESRNTVIQGGSITKIAKGQIEKDYGKKKCISKNDKELRN